MICELCKKALIDGDLVSDLKKYGDNLRSSHRIYCGGCALRVLAGAGYTPTPGGAPVCAWCNGPTVNDQLLHGSLRCPGRKERGEQ
jgi:hypothetical protein